MWYTSQNFRLFHYRIYPFETFELYVGVHVSGVTVCCGVMRRRVEWRRPEAAGSAGRRGRAAGGAPQHAGAVPAAAAAAAAARRTLGHESARVVSRAPGVARLCGKTTCLVWSGN